MLPFVILSATDNTTLVALSLQLKVPTLTPADSDKNLSIKCGILWEGMMKTVVGMDGQTEDKF